LANKIYISPESTITFAPSGGDILFTPTSIASGAGRVSARKDFGASARAQWFEWRAKTKFNTDPVDGETIDIYLCTSDGTIEDSNLGTADAAVSDENLLKNLHYIGSISVEGNTAASSEANASGVCRIVARHASVVWWNSTADALSSTAADHSLILTPIPDEIQ